jgi:hypothetical protein
MFNVAVVDYILHKVSMITNMTILLQTGKSEQPDDDRIDHSLPKIHVNE